MTITPDSYIPPSDRSRIANLLARAFLRLKAAKARESETQSTDLSARIGRVSLEHITEHQHLTRPRDDPSRDRGPE
jgi:hypothetical protein